MELHHLSNLRQALIEANTTVVVGIGAELRGDDVSGVLVARAVTALGLPGLVGIEGCAAPENFTGEILSHNPDLVIFIDAAQLGLTAGQMRIIEASEIKGFSFSTHTLPLHLILNYLACALPGTRFIVVGIQPEDTQILAPPSEAVIAAVQALAGLIATGHR